MKAKTLKDLWIGDPVYHVYEYTNGFTKKIELHTYCVESISSKLIDFKCGAKIEIIEKGDWSRFKAELNQYRDKKDVFVNKKHAIQEVIKKRNAHILHLQTTIQQLTQHTEEELSRLMLDYTDLMKVIKNETA